MTKIKNMPWTISVYGDEQNRGNPKYVMILDSKSNHIAEAVPYNVAKEIVKLPELIKQYAE